MGLLGGLNSSQVYYKHDSNNSGNDRAHNNSGNNGNSSNNDMSGVSASSQACYVNSAYFHLGGHKRVSQSGDKAAS